MKRIVSTSVLPSLAAMCIAAGAMAEGVRFNGRFAPSEGFVNRLEKGVRADLCLNGLWEFQGFKPPAEWKEGKGVPPELPAPAADGWDKVKIRIPSPWNVNNFCLRRQEGPDHRDFPSYPDAWRDYKMGWLRRFVTVPPWWAYKADRTMSIRFEAVAGECVVFANGKKVAENFDLFLPFEADVTDIAKPGETFELLVGVRGQKLFEDRSGVGRGQGIYIRGWRNHEPPDGHGGRYGRRARALLRGGRIGDCQPRLPARRASAAQRIQSPCRPCGFRLGCACWTPSNNCMTFTFNVVATAAGKVGKDNRATQVERRQARAMVSLSFLSCWHLTPSHIKATLSNFAKRTIGLPRRDYEQKFV